MNAIGEVERESAGVRLLQHPHIRVVAQAGLAQAWEIGFLPSGVVYFRHHAEAFFRHAPAAGPGAAPSQGSRSERVETTH